MRLEPSIEAAAVPVERLAANYLSELDPRDRAAVLERITGVLGPEVRTSADVSRELQILRDAVRPKLPPATVDPAADYAAHVDGLWRLDSSSFYIKGWIYGGGSDGDPAVLVTPEGWRIDLLSRAFRHPRADVSEFFGASPRDRFGFIACIETPEETPLSTGWILEVGRGAGTGIEVEVPPVIDDPAACERSSSTTWRTSACRRRLSEAQHSLPALTRLEERRAQSVEIETIDEYGAPAQAPVATIVIPLYRRVGYLEYQLAQFVHDPEIRRRGPHLRTRLT